MSSLLREDVVFNRVGNLGAGEQKWADCVSLGDGRVVCAPFTASSILVFDPVSGTSEQVGDFGADFGKWFGCSATLDGKVVFAPYNALSILIFDPATGSTETVGHFPGGRGKWQGCTTMHDGRIVFAPGDAPSILLYDPVIGTTEHIGHFDGEDKFDGCVTLHDGRVAFVPRDASSILIFDPSSGTTAEVGSFGSMADKWSGGTVLPDGRVVFAPCRESSILVFDPVAGTTQQIGDFGEGLKWDGCTLLQNGMVLFSPYSSGSFLLFDPDTGATQRFDAPDGIVEYAFHGCTACSNGSVVFVPYDADAIFVAQCDSWHHQTRQKAPEMHALTMMRALWNNRQYTDAVVEAGEGASDVIHVHREVLASSSEVLAKMFAGAFVEARTARIRLPEDMEIVNAVLEYMYTGKFPLAEPELVLRALPLAHRLELPECVAACAAITAECDAAQAVRILAPYSDDTLVKPAWKELRRRLSQEEHLLESVLRELARPHFVAERCSAASQVDAGTQTDKALSDLNSTLDEGYSDESQGPSSGTDHPSRATHFVRSDFAAHLRSSSHSHISSGDCCILHFSHWSHKASTTFNEMELVQSLAAPGVAMRPAWAQGAAVLVAGLSASTMQTAGVVTSKLRPWNVVVLAKDAQRLIQAVRRSMSPTERPRVKSTKTKIFALPATYSQQMQPSGAGRQNQLDTEAGNLSDRVYEEDGDCSDLDEEHFVADAPPGLDSGHATLVQHPIPDCDDGSASLSSPRPPSDVHDDIDENVSEPTNVMPIPDDSDNVGATVGAQRLARLLEEPETIDPVTAAKIQHEQWASGVEKLIASRVTVVEGTPMEVRNSFVHFGAREAPCSPRTVVSDPCPRRIHGTSSSSRD